MIESKLAKIILLDGSQLDFYITPDISTNDLLDMVASYLTLKEKEYFGLCYLDTTGHRNWLQSDKKVLDYDFPKKNNLLILFFRVKFFMESISMTKDKLVVELFYQQTKVSIAQGEIDVGNELLFELTGLVLQASFGDYKNDSETIKHIRTLPILPKTFLSSPNLASKEQKIINYYKKSTNLQRGQSIVNYLTITEKLCNYGVHFYEVKDKSNLKWYLGISFRGIGLYEYNNKITSKKMFSWSNLENLYYRDRKFSIEVHENNENEVRQIDLNEDTFNPVKVYAWFASMPTLCKSIWLMAVSQHQFFLDKRQNKDILMQYKSLNDLANEITNSNNENTGLALTTMNSNSNINNNINHSKHNNITEPEPEVIASDESTEKGQLLNLLKKKQEILKNKLEIKKNFYGKVKSREESLIEFSKLIPNDKSSMFSVLTILRELKEVLNEYHQSKSTLRSYLDEEYELQKKLIFVALNLASDPSASQLIQKTRREFYQRAKVRFTNLEDKKNSIEKNFPSNDVKSATGAVVQKNFNSETLKVPGKFPNFIIEDVPSLFDSSPPSIHRKDSYRLAQEHKLFLENNSSIIHKPNRPINGRRIKNILSDRQFNCSVNNTNGKELNIIDNTFFKVNNSLNNFEKVYENNLYDIKSYKDDPNEQVIQKPFSTTSSDIVDVNSVNSDKVHFEINSPHLYQNDFEALNSQMRNNEIPIKCKKKQIHFILVLPRIR